MAFVELTDVHKSFAKGRDRVEVLLGIDLAVDAGAFLALMGPSGSGKTTLRWTRLKLRACIPEYISMSATRF